MVARMRTIGETYNYIKEQDSETSITPFALRRMVLSGVIPSVRSGKKFLIDIDLINESLHKTIKQPEPECGVMRKLPERIR